MDIKRIKFQTENLTEDDYHLGFGFNKELLSEFLKLRSIKDDNQNSHYLFDFVSIDGIQRKKSYHPLLGKKIHDLEDDRILIIESVHTHWYFGFYKCLVYRMEGTRSHGTLIYENINCYDETVLEILEENKDKFVFL